MEFTARQLSQILKGTVDGDPQATVTSFAKIEHGKPGQLCFYANPKYERYVYTCRASVLLVNKDFEPKSAVTSTMVRVDDAYKALADLLKYVAAKKKTDRRYRGWRSTTFLSTKFGRKVYVGNGAYVGRRTRVGDNSKIYENVYVGDDVRIGKRCILYPGVVVYPGTVIGDSVIIHAGAVIGSDGFGNAPLPDGTWEKIEHIGNVVIGNNVEIGSCTTIDRSEMESTIIGNGVKIDNLCQIAHNVQVGDNTVMAAQCGIAGSTKIGKNCILAGQVGIAGHLTIADNTTVGAQCGIIGNVRKSGQVLLGSPSMPLKNYLRSYAVFKRQGQEDAE
ncbi:MAG: UDP-3-O-(3-hydroxymyristoyl)glucosamine N-acyltransferase [Bacteroidales bacterium]|nr:UDP-3-O-(3-hydroxymyristoyl)glucosamine N-acyltransferase [Bacteroidales bacterium]